MQKRQLQNRTMHKIASLIIFRTSYTVPREYMKKWEEMVDSFRFWTAPVVQMWAP